MPFPNAAHARASNAVKNHTNNASFSLSSGSILREIKSEKKIKNKAMLENKRSQMPPL